MVHQIIHLFLFQFVRDFVCSQRPFKNDREHSALTIFGCSPSDKGHISPLIPESFYIRCWFSFLNLFSNQRVLRKHAKEMWGKEETENLSLIFACSHCISCPIQQLSYIFLVYSFITEIMVEALLVLYCILTFIKYVFSEM